MFSYICIGTHDLSRAVAFYDAVMAPLGHSRIDLDLDGGNASWRPQYGPHFHAAYPLDTDNNKFSVVCYDAGK